MKLSKQWALTLSAIGLLSVVNLGGAFGDQAVIIRPQTPEAAQAIATLSRARDKDNFSARSYTSGATSPARSFYYKKAREAQGLIDQLKAGSSITSVDVADALDTRDAQRYTGGY